MQRIAIELPSFVEQIRDMLKDSEGSLRGVAARARHNYHGLCKFKKGGSQWLTVPELILVYCALTHQDPPDDLPPSIKAGKSDPRLAPDIRPKKPGPRPGAPRAAPSPHTGKISIE